MLQRLIDVSPEQQAAAISSVLWSSISPDASHLRTSVLGVLPDTAFDLTTDPPTVLDDPLDGATVGFGEYTLLVMVDDEVGPAGVLTDRSGEWLGRPRPFSPDHVRNFDVSEDGRYIALWRSGVANRTASAAGLIDVIRSNGELVRTLEIPNEPDVLDFARSGEVSLSADGGRVAASISGSGVWAMWSTSTGELLARGAPPGYVNVTLAGSRLFGERTAAGIVDELDPDTFEPIRTFIGHSAGVRNIVVDESTDRVATYSYDGTVRVWSGDSAEQFGRELPSGLGRSLEWAANGTVLKVPMLDRVAIWNYDTSTWADIACEVAGRNLTRDEWDRFGPETIPYRKTCDQFPLDT